MESLCPPSVQMDPALCPLRKEKLCPFMLWVTLPREYVKAMMNCTLETGWNFGMVFPDVAYMGEHFNFAFSPRSALLLHAFNISISQVQGTFVWMNATLMHLSLLDLGHFGKTGSRIEGHFGTGPTWITLYSSRDLSS